MASSLATRLSRRLFLATSAASPADIKGLGDLGTVGAAAAIANAVCRATGVRVRDLPIRVEKLLV
jgi:CO/xanthine dehydrogenase Mo-binding subunit